MPQIGPLEILVVGVFALLVFGPDKLPDMARSVGKGLAQMRSMASDMKSEFDLGGDVEDESSPVKPVAVAQEKPDAQVPVHEPPFSTTPS